MVFPFRYDKLPALLMLGFLLAFGLVLYSQFACTFRISAGQVEQRRPNGASDSELSSNVVQMNFEFGLEEDEKQLVRKFANYTLSKRSQSGLMAQLPDGLDAPMKAANSLAIGSVQELPTRMASADEFQFDQMQPEEVEMSEALRLHYAKDPVLHHLTSKKMHEMPALKSSFSQEDEEHLEASYNFFYRQDELHMKHRVSDFGLMALVAKAQSMVYSDIYNHRYDTFQDLRLAAGPSVDNERCIMQLEALSERAIKQAEERYHSMDINLFQLLDTWGHISSGLFVGNAYLEGMYHECLRLKIRTNQSEELPTRYCVVAMKHNDWPRIDRHDILSLKAGVCLPKSCDSTNYKNKNAIIMRLLEMQLRPIEQGQIKFTGLYCLPDEDSPLRQVRHSKPALLVLASLAAWLILLLYCTYKHHKLAKLTENQHTRSSKKFGLTNMSSEQCPTQASGSSYFKIYEMLSVKNNLCLLFNTQKESSLVDQSDKTTRNDTQVCNKKERVVGSTTPATPSSPVAAARQDKIVDLGCIDGIKVIAMTYVISGHVLMCITTLMQNGREMAGNQSMAFFLANLVPAFAVNAFFTITGTLTSFLMFKQNQAYPFMASPVKWAAFIVYRYLRIMPMYALVVLYCKTLAKYTGSGPLWDYATSSLGQRRACEQESWSVTLLFRSNFMPPLEHCIPGGWYLSNDFQFFLVTPLFLALLYKQPQIGQLLLYVSTCAGFAAGFWSIYGAQVQDLKPIAMFAPHGFKTYISHFSHNYTQPQYRIPAYLIGLIIGYNLFIYERAKLAYLQKERRTTRAREQVFEARPGDKGCSPSGASEQSSGAVPAHGDDEVSPELEPDWSAGFKRYAISICLLLISVCCLTPVIGSQLPFTSSSARFMVALITPAYHVMFALAVGLYILLATTGHGSELLNGFLAANFWKPLARLSLCAVLVNVEVINYIIQSNSNLHYISNQFHVSLNLICILATYAVSVLVCVLFESPIRAALNTILTGAIKRVSIKHKREKTN